MNYKAATLDKLLDVYMDEHLRINDEDRQETQKRIELEIEDRIFKMMSIIKDPDVVSNVTSKESAMMILRYTLHLERYDQ